jgi:thioredoxin reductase
MTLDLVIIGGGPAGVAAAVYAARKRLRTALITPHFEGQSTVSEKIENWIGTPAISGAELARQLEAHAKAYEGEWLEIIEKDKATYVTRKRGAFVVTTQEGKSLETHTVLIASGSSRRKITVPGSDRFENKGIVYCASCDGPLFAGMDLMVIGGGNAAFETAMQLLSYATTVTIVHRSETFRADAITVEKVLSHPNVRIIKNAVINEVKGTSFVESAVVEDVKTGTKKEIPVKGVFVEIGSVPNTDLAADIVKRDEYNRITVNAKNQRTSRGGIWAAGDCTDSLFQQNNIAVGDAVKAVEDIFMWVKHHEHHKNPPENQPTPTETQ